MGLRGPKPGKRQGAAQWLWTYLSGGKRPSKEIKAVGAAQGYGYRILNRCKAERGILSLKVGHDWYWRRPDVPEPNPEEITLATLARKIDERSAAAIAASAPVASPTPAPQLELPFDIWSDKDFEGASVEEIREHIKVVTEDLEDFMRWHGKLPGGLEGPEEDAMDHSKEIKTCGAEIAKARAWLTKKMGPLKTF